MTVWLSQDVSDVMAAGLMVAGLSVCLFGLRIRRAVLSLSGLTVGAAWGASFALSRSADPWLVLGLALAAGCVLMLALGWFHRTGTLLAVSFGGGWLAWRLALDAGVAGSDLAACAAGGALVAAVVLVLLETPLVAVLCAAGGAWAAVWAVSFYWGTSFGEHPDVVEQVRHGSQYVHEWSAIMLLSVIGLWTQAWQWIEVGPDLRELAEALDRAELSRRRRVAVLDTLAGDRLITRDEYVRHLLRILAGRRG